MNHLRIFFIFAEIWPKIIISPKRSYAHKVIYHHNTKGGLVFERYLSFTFWYGDKLERLLCIFAD